MGGGGRIDLEESNTDSTQHDRRPSDSKSVYPIPGARRGETRRGTGGVYEAEQGMQGRETAPAKQFLMSTQFK